jgi:hypothetical protein
MGLFGKKAQPTYDHEKVQLARNLNEAEVRCLEGLRREIANLIVLVDPDLMTRCYEKSWNFEREIAENVIRAQAEEAALVAKFTMFSEFDLLGTRHFITYSEARNVLSDEDLTDRYHEISRMLVFMRRRDEFKSKYPVHDAKEHKILCERMQAVKDRSFRERIENTMARFYSYRAGLEKGDPSSLAVTNFENADVEIFHLPSVPDNEYGIVFKKTGQFGVYGFHVFDDGKISYSYYRSDALFKERHVLFR